MSAAYRVELRLKMPSRLGFQQDVERLIDRSHEKNAELEHERPGSGCLLVEARLTAGADKCDVRLSAECVVARSATEAWQLGRAMLHDLWTQAGHTHWSLGSAADEIIVRRIDK